MTWYRLNRTGLWKMASKSDEALELVTRLKGPTTIIPANLAPDTLVVDLDAPDPRIVAPAPTGRVTKRLPACDALVKKWEGYHRVLPGGGCEAYPDPGTGGKPWTIGFGTTRYAVVAGRFGRSEVKPGDTLSRSEAEMELSAELDECETWLRDSLTAPVTQAMFDALISFAYNVGPGGALKQVNRVNEGKYEECARSFDLYVNAAGRPLPGLIARRNEEEALFRSQGLNPSAPAPKPTEIVARLTADGDTYEGGSWDGLLALTLTIGDEKWSVASGARGAQVLRRPEDPRSFPKNLEPLPQGRYAIGDIDWASKVKDNYNGTHGHGLGPVWVPLTAQFPDDRSSFGMHLDANIGTSPGSAGCVVVGSVDSLKRLVAALRKYDPKVLSVEWGL